MKLDTLAGYTVMGLGALLCLAMFGAIARDSVDAKVSSLERGRYLVQTSGCNDCHTAGYAAAAGLVPEKDWLQGDSLGWNGPWGTTYASNLRLYMQDIDAAEWLERSGALTVRPPMPWFMLRDMTQSDRLAIYLYIRSLGPAGRPAPAYLPPGITPPMPYFEMHLPSGDAPS